MQESKFGGMLWHWVCGCMLYFLAQGSKNINKFVVLDEHCGGSQSLQGLLGSLVAPPSSVARHRGRQ